MTEGASQEVRRVSAADAEVGRTPIDVAVGILVETDDAGREGRFLLTTRPEGKVWSGHWEFPGGKFEPGETVQQALQRELREELGIETEVIEPWQMLVMDYSHARVRLHFCKVRRWSGELRMLEGQQMAWQTLPVEVVPVLPGTVPVLEWFAAERGFSEPTHRG